MERKNKNLSQDPKTGSLDTGLYVPYMQSSDSNRKGDYQGKVQNQRAKWMADAKWGLLAHFMGHVASDSSTLMPKEQWIKKVNSFNVKKFGDQLSALKVPYFFITIGQGGNYFCTPNKTFDKHFGKDTGVRPERDLVADIIAELSPRGIRTCVYLPAYGAVKDQNKWVEVIAEWSERWGKSISAWWLDGIEYPSYPEYMTYINAVKAGNKDVLVATKLASRLDAEQVHEDYTFGESGFLLKPPTDQEDYFAGQADWLLPVCQVRYFDKYKFWVGPEYYGDQLHFLTFLGSYWGVGEPRFPDDLVVGWTQHTNNYGGTVSFDVPLGDSGIIPENHYRQLAALHKNI